MPKGIARVPLVEWLEYENLDPIPEMEPVRIFSIRLDRQISNSTPAGRPFLTRPADRFFTEGFCSLFNASNKKLSKGEHGWGAKLCDSGRGTQKKTQKKFLHFLQK